MMRNQVQEMTPFHPINRLDRKLTVWLTDHSVSLLRVSLGIVFLGFGALKFIPGASPAEEIATRVTSMLSLGLVPDSVGLALVATMETTIGLSLLTGRYLKVGLALLGMALVGILAPLALFPQDLLDSSYAPTLTGQYVFKDLILAAAALVVAVKERGAALVIRTDDRDA